jgi:hypothetical protein
MASNASQDEAEEHCSKYNAGDGAMGQAHATAAACAVTCMRLDERPVELEGLNGNGIWMQ